jgi:alkylated DNA repair dioxygenase AlkB
VLPRRFALRIAAHIESKLIGPKIPLTGGEVPEQKRVRVNELSAEELESLIKAAQEEKTRREEQMRRELAEQEELLEREAAKQMMREAAERERMRQEAAEREEQLRQEEQIRRETAERERREMAEKMQRHALAKPGELVPINRWAHGTAAFEHYTARINTTAYLSNLSACEKEGTRLQFGDIAFQKESSSVATLKKFDDSRIMRTLKDLMKKAVGVEYNFALVKCDVATGVWHSDDDPQIDQSYPIASIGFTRGSARKFHVRVKGSATTSAVFILNSGDVMIMGGENCQQLTEHAEKDEPGTTYINVMFFMIKQSVFIAPPPVLPPAPREAAVSSSLAKMFTLVQLKRHKVEPVARWTYQTAIFEQVKTRENFLYSLWSFQPQAAPVSWSRFGTSYYTEDRKTLEFGSAKPNVLPLHDNMVIKALVKRVKKITKVNYNSVFITFYTSKGSYDWHSENDPLIDHNYPITIITFCSTVCKLQIRARANHSVNTTFLLDNGHMVVMGGRDCQRLTQHTVPAQTTLPADFKRVNVSFRVLRSLARLPTVSSSSSAAGPPLSLSVAQPPARALPALGLGPPPSLAQAAAEAAAVPSVPRQEPAVAPPSSLAVQPPSSPDIFEELRTLAHEVDLWDLSSQSSAELTPPIQQPVPSTALELAPPVQQSAPSTAPEPAISFSERLRKMYESTERKELAALSDFPPLPPSPPPEGSVVNEISLLSTKIDRLRADVDYYKLMAARAKDTPDFESAEKRYERAETELAEAEDELEELKEDKEMEQERMEHRMLEAQSTVELTNQLEALHRQLNLYSGSRDIRHAYDITQLQDKIQTISEILAARRGEDITSLDTLKGMLFELDGKLRHLPAPTDAKTAADYFDVKDKLDLISEQIEQRTAEVYREFLEEREGELQILEAEYNKTSALLPSNIRTNVYSSIKDVKHEESMEMFEALFTETPTARAYVLPLVAALDEIIADYQNLAKDIQKYKTETRKITSDMLVNRRVRLNRRLQRERVLVELPPIPKELAPPPQALAREEAVQPAPRITAAMLETSKFIKHLNIADGHITVNTSGYIYYPPAVKSGYIAIDARGQRIRDTGFEGYYLFIEGPNGETFTLRMDESGFEIARYPRNTDPHGKLSRGSAQAVLLPSKPRKILDNITFTLSPDRLQGACSIAKPDGAGCNLYTFDTRTLQVFPLAEYTAFTVRCMVFLSDSSLALLSSSGHLIVRKPDGRLKQLSTTFHDGEAMARDALDRIFIAQTIPSRLSVVNSSTGEVEAHKDYIDAIPQSVAVDLRNGNVYVVFESGDLYCMMCK